MSSSNHCAMFRCSYGRQTSVRALYRRSMLFFRRLQSQTFPCSGAKAFCCGQPCQRVLKCENHLCHRPCHLVTGAKNNTEVWKMKTICLNVFDFLMQFDRSSRQASNVFNAKKCAARKDLSVANIPVQRLVIQDNVRLVSNVSECDAIVIVNWSTLTVTNSLVLRMKKRNRSNHVERRVRKR